MQKITGRKFLQASAGTALTLGMPGFWANCAAGKNPTLPPSSQINAEVAAVRGMNLDAMTRDALDALGGMRTIVNEGETVFIKPNFVSEQTRYYQGY